MGTIRESFRQMKAIMDEKIIWFAYYKEEPIAFILCLPDVNQILKHVNGKLNLWGKLKFLWYKTLLLSNDCASSSWVARKNTRITVLNQR